jgi:hypothetical protein
VLRAGLLSAAWITVDDTGPRHKAANGFCTQIGNPHFAWFGTTGSKSQPELKDRVVAAVDHFKQDPVVRTWFCKLVQAA